MAIRTLLTRGLGNGTFQGTPSLLVLRGYIPGAAIDQIPLDQVEFFGTYADLLFGDIAFAHLEDLQIIGRWNDACPIISAWGNQAESANSWSDQSKNISLWNEVTPDERLSNRCET